MEIGIYTFAENTPDPRTGHTVRAAERLRNLIEEIELAETGNLLLPKQAERPAPTFVS